MDNATKITETERLVLRKFTSEDGPFIFTLLNSPGWLEFIGNRNINTLEDAQYYLVNGPMLSYNRFGYGPYLVLLKDSLTPIGMCSLIKRDLLEDVDIGFAFLPGFSGKGYAFEASGATIRYAKDVLGIAKIIAITNMNNEHSIRLLKKLGFVFKQNVKFPDEDEDLLLFGEATTL
jgi:ribosomal-protein-alanine N-acetyltransferase